MSPDSIQCLADNCTNLIQPATAKRNNGLCQPCADRIKAQELEEYIRKNRVDIDPYQGIDDPVEIIKIMDQTQTCHPLNNYLPYHKTMQEVYKELSLSQAGQLLEYVIEQVKDYGTNIDQYAYCLSAYTDISLTPLLRIVVSREMYDISSSIFWSATGEIRDMLFEQLEHDRSDRNSIIRALACIGDDEVVEAFAEWEMTSPKWTDELYLSFIDYAHYAGWELNQSSKKRNLHLNSCYPLVPVTNSCHCPVIALTSNSQCCKWCGNQMVNLLEFKLNESLSKLLNFDGDRLIISTCGLCSSYGSVFYMDIDNNGCSVWSNYNEKPEYLPDEKCSPEELFPKQLMMSFDEKKIYESVEPYINTEGCSQVGGLPTWEQHAEYPVCPKCQRTMIFIGQVSMEDIQEYGEGIYYAFLCSQCRMAATSYQQT